MEDWLRSIGLARCIPAFQAERIEHAQLADLTEDDLKELGLSIGERRRFRRAVVELGGERAPLPAVSTLTERRPLTMMFVDLVGSSELGEALEPEDLLEVIRLYREFCGAAIRRFGGSVARWIGDGVLAYFSYPLATENDPERAVRAALEIARDIALLDSPAARPLRVRIGIATGQVIISDMLSGGAADLRTIIGTPPNLAARLQGLAQPGDIVIARETYERVRDLFACEEFGPAALRGFAPGRSAWRVTRERPRHGWRPGARPRELIPFRARLGELAVLGEHWARATGGEGRAVLVAGEAGIGKSRLIETFLALNCQEDCRVARLGASPLDSDSALLPFAAWLRAEAGGDGDASAKEGAGAAPMPADRADLAELLGIATAAAAGAAPPPTPARLRELMLAALTARLLALSESEPLCLVVEDLHWLDPSSLEVLERLVARIGGRRAMLLMAARDGFTAPFLSHPSVSTLTLPRLGAEDVAAMARGLFEHGALPAHVLDQLVRKSDGVPLFVVELLRGLLGPDGGEAAARLLDEPEAEIPASIHDSLMARLDRAGLAKEVAQIAAVIGRSVRPELLSAVAGRPAAELERPLAMLVAAGVLHRDSDGDATAYIFSHALVRDTAYASVLRDQRQALHLRVARTLPGLDPALVQRQPELLALHLTEGGRADEAATHWMEAARRSLTRSALTEATRLLKRGLAALEKSPRGDHDLRLRMTALLGPALIALRGPGSAEAQELYANAYQLCQDSPDDVAQFPIYWGWWRVSRDFAASVERAKALLGRARLRADSGELLQAHHCAWASHFYVGALRRSRDHAMAGLALYEGGDYREQARLYGNHDAKVCAHGELCEIHWLQGRPSRARRHEREAIDWARRLNHLGSLLHALDYQLVHRAWGRDLAGTHGLAGDMIDLADEHALADYQAKALIFRGWAIAMGEDVAAGRAMLEEGIARQRDIGTEEDLPVYLSLLAEVLLRAGEAARAAAEVGEALARFDRTGLRVAVPELVRWHGEALAAERPRAAERSLARFAEASTIAEQQGADMLRLRASLSAARTLLRLGDPGQGARVLHPALEAMAEDDAGDDFREAAALMGRFRELGVALAVAR